MEDTHTSSGSGGGYTDLKRLMLVLCLAGLQSATVLTTDKEKGMSRNAGDNSANDALEVLVAGPDYATVGVPCTFECEADCPPSNCTYSMAVGNQSAPGQVDTLSFTIPEWVETMTVTCTVKDDGTGRAGAMTKTLQVLAGPANISIRALVLNNTYSCQAYCRPACNYTWWIQIAGQWQGMGQAGNVFTVPHAYLWLGQPAITCKAINSVSGLFISATSSPTLGPSRVTIFGPEYTAMGRTRLFCVAQCVPPCRYLWHMDNKTVGGGNEIEVTVDHPHGVNVTCEAQNTVSGRSGTVSRPVWVSDALEVLVAGPDYATVGVPCTFECEADCPPSNCTYSMAVGNQSAPGQVDTLSFTIPEWVETMTVTCTVKDDGTGRAGAMTKTLQVLAGPANISIRALVLNNTYSCQAYCRPACNYTWWIQIAGQWQGMGQAGNVFTVPHAYLWLGQPAITCKAINSVSGLFISATSSPTLGPSRVTIFGPEYTAMGRTRLFCVAQCVPPCRYLWHMDNKTVGGGNEIEVTVDHPHGVNVTCEAQNTVSGRSGTVSRPVWVSGHSTALRDQQISAMLLCALVFSAVIYL